jgi:type I restriction enzyme S subunit
LAKDLPSNWDWCTLEDVVEFLDSKRVPVNEATRKKRMEGKPSSALFPYYGANGQVGLIDGYIFDEPLVLLAEDGGTFDRLGKVAYRINGRTWVNNHAHVLRPFPGVDIGYLQHALNASNLMPFVSGTTRLKLNQNNAKRIPLPLAPEGHQKKMSSEIDKLFYELNAGRSAIRKGLKFLNQARQSILSRAFRGEMTYRDPGDDQPEQLLNRLSQKHPEDVSWKSAAARLPIEEKSTTNTGKLGDENLPQLPPGWVWVSFGQLIQSMKNGIYKRPQYYGSGIPCLRMYNIEEGAIVWKNVKLMRLSDDEVQEYGLTEGDILLNRVNSRELVGKAAVIPAGLGALVFESKNIRIRVWRDLIDPRYLTFYLLTTLARTQITSRTKQTVGMATVSQDDIVRWPIPFCSPQEQTRLVNQLEAAFERMSSIRQCSEEAIADSDRIEVSILVNAFRGNLVADEQSQRSASTLLERIREWRTRGAESRRVSHDAETSWN